MGKILISQKLVGINLKIGPLMATGHKPVRYVGPGGNRCAIFSLHYWYKSTHVHEYLLIYMISLVNFVF